MCKISCFHIYVINHYICYVTGWYRGEKRAIKFAIPRIWRQPTDHSSYCYFCMVDPTKRRTGKNAPQIVYPDIPSFIAPVPHYTDLPIPTPRRGISHLQELAASHTARKILEIQIRVSQMRLRREGHTSLTRKTSAIWSETLVLPSPMLRFWNPGSSSATCWMKSCKSQIRESVTKQFLTFSVGKMGCASATMWPVYSRL